MVNVVLIVGFNVRSAVVLRVKLMIGFGVGCADDCTMGLSDGGTVRSMIGLGVGSAVGFLVGYIVGFAVVSKL